MRIVEFSNGMYCIENGSLCFKSYLNKTHDRWITEENSLRGIDNIFTFCGFSSLEEANTRYKEYKNNKNKNKVIKTYRLK